MVCERVLERKMNLFAIFMKGNLRVLRGDCRIRPVIDAEIMDNIRMADNLMKALKRHLPAFDEDRGTLFRSVIERQASSKSTSHSLTNANTGYWWTLSMWTHRAWIFIRHGPRWLLTLCCRFPKRSPSVRKTQMIMATLALILSTVWSLDQQAIKIYRSRPCGLSSLNGAWMSKFNLRKFHLEIGSDEAQTSTPHNR